MATSNANVDPHLEIEDENAILGEDPPAAGPMEHGLDSQMSPSELRMLACIQSQLDTKISQLRLDMSTKKQPVPEDKKFRSSTEITWAKKGNRLQYELNEKVFAKLQLAQRQLNDPLAENQVAGEKSLCEAMESLVHRQKLIRIADRSPAGWATTAEYEQDELAENPDDDKKLRGAEARAMRKMRETQSNRKNRVSKPYSRPNDQPSSSGTGVTKRPFRGGARRQATKDDTCYGCGEKGHFRSNCQKASSA